MKYILRAFAVAIVIASWACDPKTNQGSDVDVRPIGGNVATPGVAYDFLTAFTSQLPCGANEALVWSIREQTAGWTAIDGSITQSGVWTAPSCGSAFLGTTLHIDAKCVSSGRMATAAVVTAPEAVTTVAIAYAIITNPGQAACLASNPMTATIQAGGTIAFYARVDTTCGSIVTPTPPATWPAICP